MSPLATLVGLLASVPPEEHSPLMGLQEYLLGAMVLVGAWVCTAIIASAGFSELFTILRERHSALWEDLGRPSKMTRLTPESSAKLKAMVSEGTQYVTDDRQLQVHLGRLGKVLLLSRILSVVGVIWLLALLADV